MTGWTRRALLRAGAAAAPGLALPSILPGPAGAFTNEPTGAKVVLGLNAAQSGPYAAEGAEELRGCALAVEHLNGDGDGGMLRTFSSSALEGAGILGKRVELAVGDTRTRADVARASARALIETEGAIMVTGGSSSGVAIAVQDLCQEAGIIFMAGLSHSNATTGLDGRANGFRHFITAQMSGAALVPFLVSEYGADRSARHLTADNGWGWSLEDALRTGTELGGWTTLDTERTPLDKVDFAPEIMRARASDADVLVLNLYGGNLVAALRAAAAAELADRRANGKELQIVLPLHTRLVAQAAGAAIVDVPGSANWHWTLSDPGSRAFVTSFQQRYGHPPSEAAHTCYCQTVLYGDAAARARSFHPCAIVEALEDFAFDGLGTGATLYRGGDHQCVKDVLVLRGRSAPQDRFALLEVAARVPAAQVISAPGHPVFSDRPDSSCNGGS